MDPDPATDPAIFVPELKNANKKLFFFCLLLFEGPKTYGSYRSTKLAPREKKSYRICRTVISLNKFDHENGEKYLRLQ
jgi:hypothetical protein